MPKTMKDADIDFIALSIPASLITIRPYQDSKTSDSVAWPPEFLLLAQAVEKKFGPMPIEED